MTNEVKLRIREMRTNGLGYKAISTALGMSRSNIRKHCIRAGLDGDPSVVSLNFELKKEAALICRTCGKKLKQKSKGRKRRYCSDQCRWSWRRNKTKVNAR
jgi:hypothetical protein